MPRSYGRTKYDIEADAIAKAIVAGLTRLEQSNCDPEHILDAMRVYAHSAPQGVRDMISVLREYCCTSEPDDLIEIKPEPAHVPPAKRDSRLTHLAEVLKQFDGTCNICGAQGIAGCLHSGCGGSFELKAQS